MKRYKHTLSNYRLFSAEMGNIVPVGLQEALPGDTFQLQTEAVIRVLPMAAPVMHPIKVRLHHFFVPHRLVWDGWENFITGGPDGLNTDTVPKIQHPGASKDLFDYYGVGPVSAAVPVSALPIRGNIRCI